MTEPAPDQAKGEAQTRPWLLPAIVAAIVAGALVGGLAPHVGASLKLLGDLFLNALMMLVVPLVMASMVVGVGSLGNLRALGSLGRRTLAYYLATTGLSVALGLLLVNVIRPGAGIQHGEELPAVRYDVRGEAVTLRSPLGRDAYDGKYVLRLTDQGLSGRITSCSGSEVTVEGWVDAEGKAAEPQPRGTGVGVALGTVERLQGKSGSAGTVLAEVLVGLIPRNVFRAMADGQVLPLIVFSLLLGAVLTTLGPRGDPLLAFFRSLNEAVMTLVHWLMVVAPVGIFGLIAGRIGGVGGFAGFWPELLAVGKYFGTVVTGLGIHGIIVLPLLLRLFAKRSPLEYARGMGAALLNAFSTASSSATLPLTMEAVEHRNGVSSRTASFVLPLGATINMDGTALYEAVAAMFIAQAYGIQIGPTEMVVVFLTATLASIGAAGIPEAGLVTMLIVLNAVHLPTEGVALLLTIDWFLDRFRTTVNVWGDAVGAGVVERLEQST